MEITIREGADPVLLAAAHAFYDRYSVAGEGQDNTDLRLLPVGREEWEGWLAGTGRHTVTAWQGQRLVGLCLGAEGPERRCGYLSYLCVAPDHRRQGIGTRLMDRLESLLGTAPETDKLEVVFHNPVHLPWLLPGCGEDCHPCMPGVDMDSTLYPFLRSRGWQDFARQNLYHQRLAGYADPPALAASRARLLSEGIQLTLYDPTCHRGLAELFDNIRNPGWKAHVLAHTDRPIVVAVDRQVGDMPEGGLVVSYTGPLSVEGSPGRGNFCGIGTRTDYRGRGIGKLVFCEMCRRHAEAGADFMSLYTGDNNPARHIYEAAGFTIVRSFMDMRKTL